MLESRIETNFKGGRVKRITKLLMIILSYAPIATVSVAAQARASEIEGQDQTTILLKASREARFRLLPDGASRSSLEDVKQRYQDLTGLTGAESAIRMKQDIDLLLSNGLVQFDEKELRSSGPSQFAF
jgi:hypothetical protein